MLPDLLKNLGFNLKKIRASIFFFAIVSAYSGYAQIPIQRYTTATDTFYWKRYTHIPSPPRTNLKKFTASKSSKSVDLFVARHLAEFPQFTNDPTQRLTPGELKKHLFPVDINGDKLPDMIFCGPGDWAPEIVQIWLNKRDSFELIFEDYQYISKFRKAEDKLVEMQTGDVGERDNYLYFTRDYQVSQINGEIFFVKGKQTVSYKYTEEPAKYYNTPIPFVSKADTLLVRASSARQNEPFIPDLDTFGNIIAKYRSKSRGLVLAYKSYGKGNDWFFVEFSPSASPSASILYGTDKMPTFIRGWVSALAIQLE